MSLYDYKMSQLIEKEDYPFYALLMCLMRQADTENTEKLRTCWPEMYEEVRERYNVLGGRLKGEEGIKSY